MLAFLLEQMFNGVQFGLMLFLVSLGVTLIFGVMHVINLSHGSLSMLGCYFAAALVQAGFGFPLAALLAVMAVCAAALLLERLVIRRLYAAGELDQVLATFGLVLMANEGVTMIWGREPLFLKGPDSLSGFIDLGGFQYPVYRAVVMGIAALAGLALVGLLAGTRTGMRIRAGRDDRDMVARLGVDIDRLYLLVFVLAGALAALGGILLAPLMAVQPGMADPILILALTVVIIGGIGSIGGTLLASIGFGIADTLGRAFLPTLLGDAPGNIVGNIVVYLIMIAIILIRPSYRQMPVRS